MCDTIIPQQLTEITFEWFIFLRFYPLSARRLRPLRWEMNCVRYLLDPLSARRLRPLRWEMNCVRYLLDIVF